jgi:acetyltransferase-like isoleucine patch superfamily enzyme
MTPELKKISIRDVSFGIQVTVVEPVNLYGCTIGDNVFIGPFTEIQKNSRVGNNTRIQSHTFICELVEIGKHCKIGHGVMFINDLFKEPNAGEAGPVSWKPTRIGDHVSIGSNATILPVTICDRTVIGAGAVVTKDIIEPGIYAGNPARKLYDLGEDQSE